ncbi:hypothetical protein OG972_47990 [Streptomyces sp. NBC_01669]|nr:hypothetical protein [Streptomyces sp. NBC_01669]
MPGQEDQTRLERAQAIGLFRYMLIREAADPTLSRRQRGTLVRELAAMTHIDPDGRPVQGHPVDPGPVDLRVAPGRVRGPGAVAAPVPAPEATLIYLADHIDPDREATLPTEKH